MAKWANDLFMDAALDWLSTNSVTEYVCSGQPANFAGIAAVALADVALGSGDYTKADGDTNGRKTTVGAKSAVTVDADGTATHVCIASADTLLYVTTCTSQVLTSGNTVNIPAWDIEVADPS